MRALLAIVLLACGDVEVAPRRTIVASAVRIGHEEAFDVMRRLSLDITAKTCVSVHLSEATNDGTPVNVLWVSPRTLHERYGGDPVSALVEYPSSANIMIATDGERPTDRWVAPTPCEVGYLWAHWVAVLAGAEQDWHDYSRITYPHPNCPGGAPPFDLVEAIKSEVCQ